MGLVTKLFLVSLKKSNANGYHQQTVSNGEESTTVIKQKPVLVLVIANGFF
jgi:hypothetical protein